MRAVGEMPSAASEPARVSGPIGAAAVQLVYFRAQGIDHNDDDRGYSTDDQAVLDCRCARIVTEQPPNRLHDCFHLTAPAAMRSTENFRTIAGLQHLPRHVRDAWRRRGAATPTRDGALWKVADSAKTT